MIVPQCQIRGCGKAVWFDTGRLEYSTACGRTHRDEIASSHPQDVRCQYRDCERGPTFDSDGRPGRACEVHEEALQALMQGSTSHAAPMLQAVTQYPQPPVGFRMPGPPPGYGKAKNNVPSGQPAAHAANPPKQTQTSCSDLAQVVGIIVLAVLFQRILF